VVHFKWRRERDKKYMRINSFEWNKANINHIGRHNIKPYEVEEAIVLNKVFYRKGKSGKYLAYGVTNSGTYITIVFVLKQGGKVRVITAREMSDKERKYYKKRKGVK
jgi:uncharacterized DUF497 family protein